MITVFIHRAKNLSWPRKRRNSEKNIPHTVQGFGKMPEQAVQALGLSHHGKQVSEKPN